MGSANREDFADAGPYDLILDIAGNPPIWRLRRALTRTGTAVVTGGEGGEKLTGGLHRQLGALALSPFIGQRLTTFLGLVRAVELQDLAPLLEAGTLAPSLHRTFKLAELQDAIRFLENGHVSDKIALTI